MIYEPVSLTHETTQDDIFRWYDEMSVYLGREPDPPHITQLRGVFPDHKLIEVWIAMYGSSSIQWDFGHWQRTRDLLISIYGEALIPYLEERAINPLHGGGTGYGDIYIAKSLKHVQAFCQNTFDTLRGKEDGTYKVYLPKWNVVHKPTGKIVSTFDSRIIAQNYSLFGLTGELPKHYPDNGWRSWEYEVQ
jgi:hypothetical protein